MIADFFSGPSVRSSNIQCWPYLCRTEYLPAEDLSSSCTVEGLNNDRTTNGYTDRSERMSDIRSIYTSKDTITTFSINRQWPFDVIHPNYWKKFLPFTKLHTTLFVQAVTELNRRFDNSGVVTVLWIILQAFPITTNQSTMIAHQCYVKCIINWALIKNVIA